MWRAKVEWDAKDLLGKTLLQVIDPRGAPWDPSERAFVTHVKFVMKKVWYRDRRERRHEAEVFDGGDAQESTGDDRPRADDEVDRERTLAVQRMLGERMMARLEEGGRAAQVFDLAMREDLEPAEMATRLKCSVDEIKAAKKQLAYHARIVRDEWTLSEERRMRALREDARKQTEEGTP